MKVYAPFAGIVRYTVAENATVATGDQIAAIEAIKMELPITAPGPGRVSKLACTPFQDVIGGDELLTIEEI
ncbi:MAG: acetyl-CoA carboxylase biotin carboxyl carrier protein subunit [Corynebacterium sp.]|nr:acetyl-CoA carboxylase biotin carboxyl carrier protein subunit [Corynebacterium sp.]